jgi:hypothetical protein
MTAEEIARGIGKRVVVKTLATMEWSPVTLQDWIAEEVAREIAAAEARGRAELATMREALRVCRDAIFDPMNEHSIVDTVWVSEIETLVDFIDAALSSETQP